MRIFLAGENEKDKYIPLIHGKTVEESNSGLLKWFCSDGFDVATNTKNGCVGTNIDESVRRHAPFILDSFYYADEDSERLYEYYGDFLLDSGAFTIMDDSSKRCNWDDYIEKYAEFINRNHVDKFFELDIDTVVGYDKVLSFRRRLESLTGKQCIPVWHNNRGKDAFIEMCKEYPYVAIGGLVDVESGTGYAKRLWKYFPWFINTAHENGARVHALGFTALDALREFEFDSVDSTAWTSGNRFGFIWRFNGRTMEKYHVPKGKRLRNSRQVAVVNYVEWIKFQQYADKNL